MAFKKRGTSKSKRYPSKKSVALKLDEVRPRKSKQMFKIEGKR